MVRFLRLLSLMLPVRAGAASVTGLSGVLPETPVAPPVRCSVELVTSSVWVCVRTTCPSGSYFSWVDVVASVSISAETRTTALPAPSTGTSMVSTFFAR